MNDLPLYRLQSTDLRNARPGRVIATISEVIAPDNPEYPDDPEPAVMVAVADVPESLFDEAARRRRVP